VDNGKRILVAYFTAAENSDVDAMSSASVTVVDGVAIKLSYLIQPFFSCFFQSHISRKNAKQ
jgi:hypothetical protein